MATLYPSRLHDLHSNLPLSAAVVPLRLTNTADRVYSSGEHIPSERSVGEVPGALLDVS